ncbi:MAG: thioredoxin domain-containing protein [Deltaproteobacteria bacterium]|nr:thioredoxin domain-containing protein [Deltaproteobacteria bacterium]
MPNSLIHETSPYLLQHAHNPVDWLPWGGEAFRRARSENRPILLSVGYSACHWCHVMEHESFEDENTASVMNRHFVNVKVDREERPDVDEIYMHAVQAFTGGHGGWPMTLFLLPDGRPYFGGTYFPKDRRFGRPTFLDVLAHASRVFHDKPAEVLEVAAEVLEVVRNSEELPRRSELRAGWLAEIAKHAEETYDARHGGFGGAPKFPPHGTLAALLAYHQRSHSDRALEMVSATLNAMARGGMYDHLGGGFARYSVDERWCIPHFEKMLYDNALLAPIYLDAARVSGQPRLERIARETLSWMSSMRAPEGGFYAATDADSEGEEGRFFVFRPRELIEVLGESEGRRASEVLSVSEDGSFEHGSSVLRLRGRLDQVEGSDLELLDRARPRLFEARERRVHPSLDDKIITSWNGLAMAAFARAHRVMPGEGYGQIAETSARFILERLVVGDRLMRTFKNGQARHLGCADDHAFVAHGLVELFEATQNTEWLDRAVTLADQMIERFWDEGEKALYFTGHDAEKLIARTRSFVGGALPSPNGIAALVFVRLGFILGRSELLEKAQAILSAFSPLLSKAPRALGMEAIAGEWLASGGHELAVVGPVAAREPFVRAALSRYLPFSVIASGEDGERPDLEILRDRPSVGGRAAAYLCSRATCQLPATELVAWNELLATVD